MRVLVIVLAGLLSQPVNVAAQQTQQHSNDSALIAAPSTPVTDETSAAETESAASAPQSDVSSGQTSLPEQVKPAALQSPADRPASGVGLGKMAVSLLIVVAIVIALGWAFKKLTLRLPGSRHIKIISSMPLGPKERLLVIEMQGKQRVLGVTAHNINLLFELENPLPEEKLASDFHTQLQSLLKK